MNLPVDPDLFPLLPGVLAETATGIDQRGEGTDVNVIDVITRPPVPLLPQIVGADPDPNDLGITVVLLARLPLLNRITLVTVQWQKGMLGLGLLNGIYPVTHCHNLMCHWHN